MIMSIMRTRDAGIIARISIKNPLIIQELDSFSSDICPLSPLSELYLHGVQGKVVKFLWSGVDTQHEDIFLEKGQYQNFFTLI